MGLDEQWSENDSEYQRTLKFIQNRTFIKAVDQLERLVVQRLFELSKANLAGTGTFQS
jgi:hypothetical protein